MAICNRDRVGKMFEMIAPPLDDFISRAVAPELDEGSFVDDARASRRTRRRASTGKEYHALDPQVQLRMLTENIPDSIKQGWYPFDDASAGSARAYCKELREARNNWAHNKSFTDDDAYRGLDTARAAAQADRRAVGADEVQGDPAGPAPRDRRQGRPEGPQVGRRRRRVAPGCDPGAKFCAPHDDVATGNFQAAEFAADLYKVASTRRRQARTTPTRSSSSRAPTSPRACAI